MTAGARQLPWLWVLPVMAAAAVTLRAAAHEVATPLQLQIAEGDVLNYLHQQGPVAAHLLLSSGTRPRVLVAFPAGNSGVGVWFENTARPVH